MKKLTTSWHWEMLPWIFILLSLLLAGSMFLLGKPAQARIPAAAPPDSPPSSAPGEQREADKPIVSFSVLSDIHIQAWDNESQRKLRAALDDLERVNAGRDLTVLNGDLTDGRPEDYRALFHVLNPLARSPVHATMGNHEYYLVWRRGPFGALDTTGFNPQWSSGQAVRLFTRSFGYAKPYHDVWVNGFHFIFLSGEAYRDVYPSIGEDAFLSAEQLQWLSSKLDERTGVPSPQQTQPHVSDHQKRRPVFVFLHQPLHHTVDGSENQLGVVQHEQLAMLLARHPEVVLFSGHTHWDLQSTAQIREVGFLAVGSSSVRQVFTGHDRPADPSLSQSLVVQVYPDQVVIRGREHSRRQWTGPAYVRHY